ncbi:carbamoyltransferase C-terminal domain-containing protein [Paenibacillus sp. FJAT-26967]|uniref:carbamoyltransferase C-terminal domain-containing protein n=1 Tax=Paenibacillus sp. FJAT-26967 TaxID=1729690 RepID=UPI00083989C9|nr:carbamoyltransferase C-terminal domain-containing protein [Paenibacillus sp. FJAT-26967]
MRDGYYLSAYLHIDPLDHMLGTIIRHDQNASLFHKSGSEVRLVRMWELERVTGIKEHYVSFYSVEQAQEVLNKLLGALGLSLDDMVEIWGTPGLQTTDDYHCAELYSSLSYHSISHLFSAMMTDSEVFYNGNILGLAVDGGPDGIVDRRERTEKCFFAGGYARQGKLDLFAVESPGMLWGWAKFYFKMREGTLMALASASTSTILWEAEGTLPVLDGRHDIWESAYIRDLVDQVNNLTDKDAGTLFSGFDPRFTERENKISMIMKQVQQASMKIMDTNIERILHDYKIDPGETCLAMAGGYTLNCPTNSHLMRKYGFWGFMAPPCVGDSGLSLGMGLYAFHKKLQGRAFRFALPHAYFGEPDTTLHSILAGGEYASFIQSTAPLDCSQAARDIQEGPIVWFDGEAEIGPRALGHRSLIADPRHEGSKKLINEIKERQWWRPVAPIILEEETGLWFDTCYPSRFMLHTFQARAEKAHLIPSVLHLDGSARVQSLGREENPVLYRILSEFYEQTGVPIVGNTSLNDRGEPIIHTVHEAFNFALRKKLRILYVNGIRIELHNHQEYAVTAPHPRSISMQTLDEEARLEAWNRLNPCGIPQDVLYHYRDPNESEPAGPFDLTNPQDAERLCREVRAVQRHKKLFRTI